MRLLGRGGNQPSCTVTPVAPAEPIASVIMIGDEDSVAAATEASLPSVNRSDGHCYLKQRRYSGTRPSPAATPVLVGELAPTAVTNNEAAPPCPPSRVYSPRTRRHCRRPHAKLPVFSAWQHCLLDPIFLACVTSSIPGCSKCHTLPSQRRPCVGVDQL